MDTIRIHSDYRTARYGNLAIRPHRQLIRVSLNWTEMRITSVKIIRRILLGVIGAVALAVFMNYLVVTLRRTRDDGNRPAMISADFRRAAEGIEVFVRKGSALRFTVRARRLRETIQEKNFLEGIEASDFNEDGSVRNSIYSDMAVYDPGREILDFDGDVRIILNDGTELRAEALHYDLNTEIGIIPGLMEFLSSNVSGRARDVRLYRDEDRLELGGEVDFSLTRESTVAAGDISDLGIRAVADRGTCLLPENRILFAGGVRMESQDMGALTADAVDIVLNDDRSKIANMTVSGNAAYEMRSRDGTRFISGGSMVFFAGTDGALEKVLISEQANLFVKSVDEERTLRAGEIEMFLDSKTGAISEIRGTRGADLLNRRGAEETRAAGDVIYAAFADAGDRLRDVRLSGHSRFSIAGTEKAANELLAETIDAHFQPESENIEILAATGGVRWIFNSPGADATRTLLASELEIRYAGNFPESGEASGAATFEETAVAQTVRRLKAERMRFDFFPGAGQIKSLIAEDNVRVFYERAEPSYESFQNSRNSPNSQNFRGERYETSSDRLEVFFKLNNGTAALWRAEQRGKFRLISDARSITADRGEYDADSGKLALTGSPEIFEIAGRVSGDWMEYDLAADELLAGGQIRAVLDSRQSKGSFFRTDGGASPVIVMAEELRYRPSDERFHFSGGVVTLTESQQLTAREITFGGDGNMTSAGGVLHRIHETGAAAIIESERMEYRQGEGLISYSGKVEMRSKEMMLCADVLNATLDDEAKELRRVQAGGNVLVRQDGRVCRGDDVEWIPASSSYNVTGNPAMCDDPERGRSTARRLTYFQGEDRVTLTP